MLLSLTLVAVVGGALAFKAKFDDSYCTTTPLNQVDACPDATPLDCTTTPIEPSIAVDPGAGAFYCYTTSDGNQPCTLQDCKEIATFEDDLP